MLSPYLIIMIQKQSLRGSSDYPNATDYFLNIRLKYSVNLFLKKCGLKIFLKKFKMVNKNLEGIKCYKDNILGQQLKQKLQLSLR